MSEPTAPNLESIAAGRYEVRGLLGQGGMAAVYRVYDRRLRVECAIKVMAPEFSAKGDLRRRFESEAATMARLRHTNIAAVYDVGDDNGSPYLVLELIAGGSLNDHLEMHGPLPPRMAAEVCISVLTALQLAHENGVIHRDIKPHNVLLARDGTAKVTDFGIARVQADDSPSMTRTGSIMGTWAYMAPEQRAGSRGIDGRADVYSTGAMLVDLLTGEAPADVFMCEMHTHMLDGVPAELRPIVQRAVRYSPAERYASASEMAQALQAAIPALPPVPEDHPKLGSRTRAPTLSPAGATPAATYAFDDEASSRPPSVGSLPGEPPDREGSKRSLAGVPPGPERQRSRGPWVLGTAAALGVLMAGVWLGLQGLAEPANGPADGPPMQLTAGQTAPATPAADPVQAGDPEQPGGAMQPGGTMQTGGTTQPAPVPSPAAVAPVKAPRPTAPQATDVSVPAAAVAPIVAPVEVPAPALTGTVQLTGDADSVLLVGNGGRFPPGEVPPGTYSIEASFAGGLLAPAGKVTVAAGQTLTIKCLSDFARCK